MKLAIIRRRHTQFGGAERAIETIAGELTRIGNDVTIVSQSWPGAPGPHLDVSPDGFTRAGKLAHFQRQVAAILAAHRFDLVQSHERLTSADIFRAGDGVHAAWLSHLAAESGPLRTWARRFGPMHRLIVATERRMARDTGMIFVANSAMVERDINHWLDIPADRIRVIENGVDRAHFHPPSTEERAAARRRFGLPDDVPVVAFVGSGFERKGAFKLVEALALPECRVFHALIAGRDKALGALQRRVNALGMAGRVQVLGGVANPLDVYHAADAFALPSLYDPMPNAALEALNCGLPLLVTGSTGIADAVREHNAGVVISRDPQALAAGLVSMFANRAAMAAEAAKLAPRFDLAAKTQQWLALYAELMRDPPMRKSRSAPQ